MRKSIPILLALSVLASATLAQKAESEAGLIWKRQTNGKWKVVLELLNPIPPKAPAN